MCKRPEKGQRIETAFQLTPSSHMKMSCFFLTTNQIFKQHIYKKERGGEALAFQNENSTLKAQTYW